MSVIIREVFGIGVLLFGEYNHMLIIMYIYEQQKIITNITHECCLE